MSKTSWIKTVLFFLVAMLLIMVAVVAAPSVVVPVEEEYVVVPVEDWPILNKRTWTTDIPPDAEILHGVAPVFVSDLSCEDQGDMVLCEGDLVVEGGIVVGAVQFTVRIEMLPVVERWYRGVVMLPTTKK